MSQRLLHLGEAVSAAVVAMNEIHNIVGAVQDVNKVVAEIASASREERRQRRRKILIVIEFIFFEESDRMRLRYRFTRRPGTI